MFALYTKSEKRWSLLVMGLVWSIASVAATLSLSVYPDNWQVQCAIGGIAALVLLRFSSIRDILFWVGLYYFFAFFLKPVGLSFSFEWGEGSRSYMDIWPSVLYYQTISFGLFVVGYVVAAWNMVVDDRLVSSRMSMMPVPPLLILYIAYGLVFLSRILIYGGYEVGVLSIISNLSPVLFGVGLAKYILGARLNRKNIGAVVFVLSAILFCDLSWALLTKAKLIIFLDLFAAAIVSSLLVKIRLWVVLIFALLAMLFIGVVTTLRGVDYLGASNILSLGFEYLMFRTNTFDTALRVFSLTPVSIPYWGSEMLKALTETVLIPFPFPGKSSYHAGVVTSQLYFGYEEPVYLALGLATSWYVVGGVALGVFAMFLHGLALSFVLNGLLLNVNSWRFMLWLAIFSQTINIEQSFLNSINYAYKLFLVTGIIIIFEWFLKKGAKNTI